MQCPVTIAVITAAVAISQVVLQYKMQQKRAKIARNIADQKAQAQYTQSRNQATRAVAQEAEAAAAETIEAAETLGQVHNYQNRGDMQMAALSRQASRIEQANAVSRDVRVASVYGDVRDAYRNIQTTHHATYAQNKGPSTVGLAIGIVGGAASGLAAGISAGGGTTWASWKGGSAATKPTGGAVSMLSASLPASTDYDYTLA
jgi:hypothetical protein